MMFDQYHVLLNRICTFGKIIKFYTIIKLSACKILFMEQLLTISGNITYRKNCCFFFFSFSNEER